MECREFREVADSYLSDELTVESNHEAMSHLERCAGCRSELSARRALRGKLRAAFIGVADNRLRPEFANHLSRKLRAAARVKTPQPLVSTIGPARLKRYWLFAVAACLLVAAAIGVTVVRQQLQRSKNSARIEHPIDVVTRGLARAAVSDHRDCAIQFRLPEKPIALEVAARKYDPVYLDLTRAIFTADGAAPPGVQFVEAHSCVFEGRRFAHLVLKYHGTAVSILVTGIPAGGEIAHASRFEEPATISCSQIKDYNVAFFQTARHAVFVVSALPEGENLALTRGLAPAIFAHISNGEQGSSSAASVLGAL
jgi:anti-sigma factor RsiW